jgi:predicted DNA binding CopG/RHH family protein
MTNSRRIPPRTKRKTVTDNRPSRIPEFANRQEEAEFWDTHSIADYWDELRPVKVTFAKNLSEGITIRLDRPTLTAVRAEARAKGIGPTTLIRMWVLERIASEQKRTRTQPRRRRAS